MSTVNYVGSTQSAGYTSGASASKSVGGNALSGDDFMLLLLAQLQHQNPLEPMDETTMMGQITQLNSLQELQKISSAIENASKSSRLTEAAALIGKNVTYTTTDGKSHSGIVTGVSLLGGETILYVGDKMVPQSSVTSVTEAPSESESAEEVAEEEAA